MLVTCPYHHETFDDDVVEKCEKCRKAGIVPVTCPVKDVEYVRGLMRSIDSPLDELSASVLLVYRSHTAARRLGAPVGSVFTPQQIAAVLYREQLAASQRKAMESVHGPNYDAA